MKIGQSVAGGLLALLMACAPTGDELPDPGESDGQELAQREQAVVPPVIRSGQPLSGATTTQFKYFEVQDALCRRGAPAGVAVRKAAGTANQGKLLIYLEGGGACFDTQTCFVNEPWSSITEERRAPKNEGIFVNRGDNPFADWNVVYVPYCTGDLHLGANVGSPDLVTRDQKYFGRKNLDLYLPSIKATFPNVQKVVLAGSSAGGAGSTGNAIPVRKTFSTAASFIVLDDAGPYLSAGPEKSSLDALPIGAQTIWRNLWGLDKTILKDCPQCAAPNYFPVVARNVATFLGRKPALVIGKDDQVVKALYTSARIDAYPVQILPDLDLPGALNDFRGRMGGSWTTFFVTTPDGDAKNHTWLVKDETFYRAGTESAVGGGSSRTLLSWVSELVGGVTTPGDYGP